MTSTPQDVLDRLVASVASGDQVAFGRLYDATVSRVSASIRWHLPDAAPDAVIERVYVELWRTAPVRRSLADDAEGWISAILGSTIARHRTHTTVPAPLLG